jgi:hypothetical protein
MLAQGLQTRNLYGTVEALAAGQYERDAGGAAETLVPRLPLCSRLACGWVRWHRGIVRADRQVDASQSGVSRDRCAIVRSP